MGGAPTDGAHHKVARSRLMYRWNRIPWSVVLLVIANPIRAANPTPQQLQAWGLNVYSKITASLKAPGSNIFSETASLSGTRSGGDSGFSYVWPAATQFRVENEL